MTKSVSPKDLLKLQKTQQQAISLWIAVGGSAGEKKERIEKTLEKDSEHILHPSVLAYVMHTMHKWIPLYLEALEKEPQLIIYGYPYNESRSMPSQVKSLLGRDMTYFSWSPE